MRMGLLQGRVSMARLIPSCVSLDWQRSELARISSHLLGLGCFAMDVGAMTVFLWTFEEREHLYTYFEKLCGARFTTSYARVGGLARDMGGDLKLENPSDGGACFRLSLPVAPDTQA